jgi:large subunit ribosomal protein L25
MTTTQIPKLNVQQRQRLGTRYAARLRKEGQLPVVVYGHKKDPLHISVDAAEMVDLLHHQAHVIEINDGAATEACLVKDVQWDHLGSTIIHVDLTRVDLSEQVTVAVNLHLVGDPVGLKEAYAMLDHPYDTIEIECRVDQIPEEITASIEHLKVGDTLTPAGLDLPQGIKCVMAEDTVLAAVRIVLAQEEEVAPAEEVEGEPEIIGREPGEEEADGKEGE